MAIEFQERRRSPRVSVGAPQEFRLGRRIRVRVVDISGSGALFATEDLLPIGARGRLQVLLGSERFEGQVEIKREQTVPGERARLLGATLTPSQPQHVEALNSFLRRAGN